MKQKFTLYLLALIVLSITTIATVVGVYSRVSIENIIEVQKQDVKSQVKSKIRIFDEVLANIEVELNEDLEAALKGLEQELLIEGKVRQDVTQAELKSLAARYNVTEIYLINAQGVVFQTTFAPDMNLNLFAFGEEFQAFIKSMYGTGEINHQRISFSTKTGIMNKYVYYSPQDTDIIIETSSKVKEVIEGKYSKRFQDFLFKTMFQSLIEENEYLKYINISNLDVRWSMLYEEKRFEASEAFLQQLTSQNEVTLEDQNLVKIYSLMKFDEANFDFSDQLIVEMHFDFGQINQFTRNILLFSGIATLLIIAFAFGISSRFFNSYMIERIIYINQRLSHIKQGDYETQLVLKGNDELVEIANNINSMQKEIQLREADLRELNQTFIKFVPHEFIRLLKKENITDLKLGDHIEASMTVLFSDIRSFTQISEGMLPRDNFEFINTYLKQMGPIIREHHGFIDKYIGDAIMALFGETTDDALKAAIQMQTVVRGFAHSLAGQQLPSIQIGIGINTGPLMLGTIGEHGRMEGTVISDAVNVASRLESLTKFYGTPILISEQTRLTLNNVDDFNLRMIDRVQVRGKKVSISIWEVLDGDAPEVQKSKVQHAKRFEEAIEAYFRQQIQEAHALFQQCLEHTPTDTVAAVYIQRCEHLLEGRSTWNPMTQFQH